MKGFVFRRNDPAVFGAEIFVGTLRHKVPIMNQFGKKIGIVHQIQEKGKTMDEAYKECRSRFRSGVLYWQTN